MSGGELYIMVSCFFFSLCTVRMGLYAPRMPPVSLAAGKKIGLSAASIGWMAANNFSEWGRVVGMRIYEGMKIAGFQQLETHALRVVQAKGSVSGAAVDRHMNKHAVSDTTLG